MTKDVKLTLVVVLILLAGVLLTEPADAGECYVSGGVGYDFKDGGSFLSGGKYDGLDDAWRIHGYFGGGCAWDMSRSFGLSERTFEIATDYDHFSSLYDGFSGSPRDSDIVSVKAKWNFLRW